MDYPGESNVITRVLRGKQEGQSQREGNMTTEVKVLVRVREEREGEKERSEYVTLLS